jgi:hypothetical protein
MNKANLSIFTLNLCLIALLKDKLDSLKSIKFTLLCPFLSGLSLKSPNFLFYFLITLRTFLEGVLSWVKNTLDPYFANNLSYLLLVIPFTY